MFLTLASYNAQRNEKLRCSHKPDPAIIKLHNQAADAYINHSNSPGSAKKAMTLLDCTIDEDPDYQLAYTHEVGYLKNQGDLIQALEMLNAYLKRSPAESRTLLGAGMFYEKLGNKKEIMDHYRHAEVNFKRLYEKDNDSAHEINRCLVIRLIEGPRKAEALYKAKRDRPASVEEQHRINDVLVMFIIETPCEQFLK